MSFARGLATGFLNAKADDMKDARLTRRKTAADMAKMNRQSLLRIRGKLAENQATYEAEIQRSMDTLGMSREEAEQFGMIGGDKAKNAVIANAQDRMAVNKSVETPAYVPDESMEGVKMDTDFVDQMTDVMRQERASASQNIFRERNDAADAAKLGYNYRNSYNDVLAAAGAPFSALFEDGNFTGTVGGTDIDEGQLKFVRDETARLMATVNPRLEQGEAYQDVMYDVLAKASRARENYEKARSSSGGQETSADGGNKAPKSAPIDAQTPQALSKNLDALEIGSEIIITGGKTKKIANETQLRNLRDWAQSKGKVKGAPPPQGGNNPMSQWAQ